MNSNDMGSRSGNISHWADQSDAGVLGGHRVPAHLARRFHQICLGVTAEVLAPERLSPIEYALIAAVNDYPGFDQRALADRLGIDPASTSQMVDRLQENGHVARTVDPGDRRARIVHATPAGTELRVRLRPALLAAQEGIMRMLKPDERGLLLTLLLRVVEGNRSYARPGNGRRKPLRRSSDAASD